MKRTLLIALFLVTGINTLLAQDVVNNSTSVNVSATVIGTNSIELVTVNTIQFGNTQPEDGLVYINPITSLNAGFMIANGNPEAEFRLNYLPQRILTQVNGNGSLVFNYEISGNSVDDQSTSELLDLENRNLRFNEEGQFYLWVGGQIDLSNAAPGNYEGDFTIEIDYI